MKVKRNWIRPAALNILEHSSTRVADAATTLLVLLILDTEVFGRLALAQAWVAPTLFFFVCPENVLYRDFRKWEAEGTSPFNAKLDILRRFAWAKAFVAIGVAAAIARGETDFFFALLWAFALSLGPQIFGPDREFLRTSLELGTLNRVNILQKFFLLLGTAAALLIWKGKVSVLALQACFVVFVFALIYRARAKAVILRKMGQPFPQREISFWKVIGDSLGSFSLWQHLASVVLNWIETMDLFFLGIFGYPPREVGLYAAALKLANFSKALPMALSNTYSVRLARTQDPVNEHRELKISVSVLLVVTLAQAVVLFFVSPWIFEFFSKGRWSTPEISTMRTWFGWILLAGVLNAPLFVLTAWLYVRTRARDVFLRLYLPLAVVSVFIYSSAAYSRSLQWVAISNVGVALLLVGLVLTRFFRQFRNIGPGLK